MIQINITGWPGDKPTLDPMTEAVLNALGVSEITVTLERDTEAPYAWYECRTSLYRHGEADTKGIAGNPFAFIAMRDSLRDAIGRLADDLQGWKV